MSLSQSMRKHNERCEHASVKSCRCSCQGKFHGKFTGIKADWKGQTRRKYDEDPNDIVLTESMGGELGEQIKKLTGETFLCLGTCNKPILIFKWLGSEHDGGLLASDGKKYWLYVHCDRCGYDTSWWKIPNRINSWKWKKEREF